MNHRGVAPCQWRWHLHRHLVLWCHGLRQVELRLQRFLLVDRVVLLATFLLLFLLLLPFLQFLGFLLHTFLVWGLCQHIDGICLIHEHAQCVSHHIADLHAECVLIHEGCVAQPVVDGVLLLARLDDKGTVGIEVQTFDDGQFRMAIAEVHTELIGVLTLRLQQETVCLCLCKCQQCHIVGQEVGIGHLQQCIDMQRVAPDGIHTGIRLRAWLIDVMAEGHHLTLLIEDKVAIGILQGIGAILARCHALHHEVPAAVSARYAQHRLGLEGRVCQIVVKSHHDTLDGFEVAGVEHVSCHFEGIDLLACREAVGIVAHRVTLVVVCDGVAEVDGVGRVLLQGVLQFHDDSLTSSFDFRHLELWWRDDNLIGGIFQFDIFIEEDGDLLRMHVG